MERLIYLLLGYLCGLFQSGYIVSKLVGVDLRNLGSGNMGATNSLRVMGKKLGALVFVGDFLKALIPCILISYFYKESSYRYIYILYTGLGVVLGHIYPFYLNFKGGKGIASTAGILCALDLRMTLVCFVIFLLTVFITRYVSLSSILVMLSFIMMSILASKNIIFIYEIYYVLGLEYILLVVIISFVAIFKHKDNIKRLLRGNENKI